MTDTPATSRAETAARTEGLRHALRHATAAEHARTEASFEAFHDDPLTHLPAFLAAQHVALESLRAASARPLPAEAQAHLDAAIRDLEHDRAASAGALPHEGAPLDPLAVSYLFLGSRLGTEVLRRRLIERLADRDDSPAMPRYFTPEDGAATGPAWRRLCQTLDTIPAGDARALLVTRDVERGYALFRRAAAATPTLPQTTGPDTSRDAGIPA